MKTPTKRRLAIALVATLLALAGAGCGPEDGRARGGGAGGDANNKPAEILPRSKAFPSRQPIEVTQQYPAAQQTVAR